MAGEVAPCADGALHRGALPLDVLALARRSQLLATLAEGVAVAGVEDAPSLARLLQEGGC